ncbi:MAG: hypothetical protein JNJ89_01850 [Rubrivivax sp.]|nr:hypothetical protein [Rubrivivax sp.]
MFLAAASAAFAQKAAPYDGYLCCSMLSDGSWISDQNYDDGYKKTVPAGTPVKFTGFGRWRLLVEIEGKKLGIGNDYSRTIDMDTFAARYVLKDDPAARLRAMAPKVRDAVLKRKVMRGMTREQVVMALGYPTASYTPDLSKPLWNYQFRSGEFQVFFTDDGRVDLLFGVPESRAKVWLE